MLILLIGLCMFTVIFEAIVSRTADIRAVFEVAGKSKGLPVSESKRLHRYDARLQLAF